MSLPTIPESVPRSLVTALCERLHLDPNVVEALEFGTFGLYVTFHATDSKGRKVTDGQEVARHRLFVPYT